jgi:hypothetical protein
MSSRFFFALYGATITLAFECGIERKLPALVIAR